MKNDLTFSIITCTWNSIRTVSETIDSVNQQDYSRVQQIFVDGGSTDGTIEFVQSHCPDALILRDVKGGISHAMNVGIKAASGDVIAHLHSDDYYVAPDVLSAVALALGSGAQWAYGNIDVLRYGEYVNAEYPMRPFSISRYAAGRASVSHPAVFVRAAAFREVGLFDESLKYAMDIDLWFRLGARYAPVQLDRSLTVFREHDGSLSTANKLKAREEDWRVRMRYFSQAPLETMFYGVRQWRQVRRLRREFALPSARVRSP